MANVEFETIKSEKINFGPNNTNFIEIARKKAITPSGENVFVSLSRGYKSLDGNERYKNSVTIPDTEEIKKFISEKIMSI